MKFRKILTHPDKELIDYWIFKEETPLTVVANRLRKKYPNRKDLQISVGLLSQYRKETEKTGRIPDLKDYLDISTRIMQLKGEELEETRKKVIFPDEKLLEWCNGSEGLIKFIEENFKERGKPIKLQDYQKEIIREFFKNSHLCLVLGAQAGKDFIMSCMMPSLAILNPNFKQLLVSATQKQSNLLYQRIINRFTSDENLIETLASTVASPHPEIYLKNGSVMWFLPAKGMIAGYTDIDVIWFNEARDITEEEASHVTPLVGIGGGKIVVASRPRFRRGFFWECANSPIFKTIKIPTYYNKYFDKDFYEKERATRSPIIFKTEYLAEFAEVGSSYISERAIDAVSRVDYDFSKIVASKEYWYSLGIDWARYRDTAVAILVSKHKEFKKMRVEYIHEFIDQPFDAQLTVLGWIDTQVRDGNEKGIDYVVPEEAGLGIPLCEQLKKRWKEERRRGRVVPYSNKSLQDKLRMYEEAKRAIERQEIQIPRTAFKLINQLKLTTFEVTPTGRMAISGGKTDDHADALCLALQGFKSKFRIGALRVIF